MKNFPIVFVTALLFYFPVANASSVAKISAESCVILKGKWEPTDDQVRQGLTHIQHFLENPVGVAERSKGEIKKILESKSGYRLQAWGIIEDGKKRIYFNFFPAPDAHGSDEFLNWRKEPVMVDDGGYDFWSIQYDPAAEECLNFLSNGYA